MKILKKNYECNLPSWYAINLAIAFLKPGFLLAFFISLINSLKDLVFIKTSSFFQIFKAFEEVENAGK